MKCPVCESESFEILKSKGKHSKEFILQCNECGNVYREIINRKKPIDIRIIISEFESSKKDYVKLYEDEVLQVDEVLDFHGKKAVISSIETKNGGRTYKSPVSNIETIWATSLELPARVGISVDFGGRIVSKKVDVDGDFEFHVGDIIKLGNIIFRVNSLKTIERKLRRGFAKADVTKRVYGKPVIKNEKYSHDLSSNIVDKL
jgi:uncharacterized Zn finger protein